MNRLASSGADAGGSPVHTTGVAANVAPEAAASQPLSDKPAASPAVPEPAPSLTPAEARPGTARGGGGSLHRIRPHWRYTWNGAGLFSKGDVFCGPCVWVMLYQSFRHGSLITLSIASGFVSCAQCGRVEA